MASTVLSIPNATALTVCDAIVDAIDTGAVQSNPVLRIYSGTPPANADAALSGNTLLAELAMSNPAFGAAADIGGAARATANSISDDTAADADGTATFFRCYDRQASPACQLQGSVGATGSGEACELNSVEIRQNAKVSVTSFTVTVSE